MQLPIDSTFRVLEVVGAIGLLFWPLRALKSLFGFLGKHGTEWKARFFFALTSTIGVGVTLGFANFSGDARLRFVGVASVLLWIIWSRVKNAEPFARRKRASRKTSVKDSQASQNFTRSRAWRELRYRVLRKYGSKCMLCGSAEKPLHVDHIKPRAKYPELALEFQNLQVLCEACNLGKSDRFEDDFRKGRKSG